MDKKESNSKTRQNSEGCIIEHELLLGLDPKISKFSSRE